MYKFGGGRNSWKQHFKRARAFQGLVINNSNLLIPGGGGCVKTQILHNLVAYLPPPHFIHYLVNPLILSS